MTEQLRSVPADAELWVDVEQPDRPAAQNAPAHVTEYDGDELVISAPQYDVDAAAPQPGKALVLRWTGDRGVHECRVALLSVAAGDPPSWRLRPIGPVERVQRREYVRAAFLQPLAIVPVDAEAPVAVVTGDLADLSEGGLRAHLRGAPLAAGTAVEVHLELESTPATLHGRVLRSDALETQPPTYETVVIFEVQEIHAARLRRVVLRQQAAVRRGQIR